MIRIHQIKVPVRHTRNDIERKIRKLLSIKQEQPFTFQIRKQSMDARRGHEVSYVYTVDVDLQLKQSQETKLIQQVHNKNIMLTKEECYRFPKAGTAAQANHRWQWPGWIVLCVFAGFSWISACYYRTRKDGRKSSQ